MEDKPIYYDDERKQMYWIKWFETGNSDIPTRHYIGGDISVKEMAETAFVDARKQALDAGLEIVEPHDGNLYVVSKTGLGERKVLMRAKDKAEQYAHQLVHVIECMLNSSKGDVTNSNFPLARAQAETIISKIKGK